MERPAMFRSASFDLVLSSFGWEFVPDLAASFSECHRLLSPGGLLVVCTVHPLSAFEWDAEERALIVTDYFNPPVEVWGGLGPASGYALPHLSGAARPADGKRLRGGAGRRAVSNASGPRRALLGRVLGRPRGEAGARAVRDCLQGAQATVESHSSDAAQYRALNSVLYVPLACALNWGLYPISTTLPSPTGTQASAARPCSFSWPSSQPLSRGL